MEKTTLGNITPGGRPVRKLENPPSSEVGPMDSGGGHLLLEGDPFQRSSLVSRSPPTDGNSSATEINCALKIENEELRTKLDKIECLMVQLRNEVSCLRNKNEELTKALDNVSQGSSVKNCETGGQEYHTDEEELARETDWVFKKKRRDNKKRKAESSPEVEIPKIKEIKKLGEQNRAQPKAQQPPPINVTGITDYATLRSLLKSVTDKEFKVTALNNNVWKINTLDSETYRAFAQKLISDKIQWHTYEDKNERPIKVMARGLHASCAAEDIKEDLRQKGLKILEAVNILKKEKTDKGQGEQIIRKKGLPLFMLTFDNKEDIGKIYNIRTILNIVVKIEPLRKKSTLIPQCKRCQGFNHTQGYCQKEPRCVKCAGKHLTSACTLNKNTLPKCVNCRGEHPASYRGCEVAKELQKRRNELIKPQKRVQRSKSEIRKSTLEPQKEKLRSTRSNGDAKTYAQAVSNEKIDTSTMGKTLALILGLLDDQKNTNKLLLDRISKLECTLNECELKKRK